MNTKISDAVMVYFKRAGSDSEDRIPALSVESCCVDPELITRVLPLQLAADAVPVAWRIHWSTIPIEPPEVTTNAARVDAIGALTDPPRIEPLYTHPSPAALNEAGGDERARFEAWAGERYDTEKSTGAGLLYAGEYLSDRTDEAWTTWQAALATRQPAGEPFGWWLIDDNGIGRLSRTPPQDTIDIYRNTPGYSATPLYAAPPAQAVDLVPRAMQTAPRDGTMVRLLVQFEDNATEDTADPAWTIGACNDDNVGDDERIGWQFAGWCWTHDHFTDGKGTPVGWLPMIGEAAQAVDLGQFREAVEMAMEVPLNSAQRQKMERLLALIDSLPTLANITPPQDLRTQLGEVR